jgi:hypothetical protein
VSNPVKIDPKWADRVITAGPTVDLSLAAQSDEQPVGIILDAQELGKLYVTKTGPRGFAQYLLEQLKAAGCPAISGSAVFRLRRGKVFKMKSKPGEMEFKYVWLPPALVSAIGMDDAESVRVN